MGKQLKAAIKTGKQGIRKEYAKATKAQYRAIAKHHEDLTKEGSEARRMAAYRRRKGLPRKLSKAYYQNIIDTVTKRHRTSSGLEKVKYGKALENFEAKKAKAILFK